MPAKKNSGGLDAALRKIAMRHPDVEESVACEGTALESATFKARKKTFLFVGKTQARLKLDESLGESRKLASKHPEACKVGSLGWVAVSLAPEASPPLDVLARWIDESYRAVASPPPRSPQRPSKSRARPPSKRAQ
jgi:hypothetical protein